MTGGALRESPRTLTKLFRNKILNKSLKLFSIGIDCKSCKCLHARFNALPRVWFLGRGDVLSLGV